MRSTQNLTPIVAQSASNQSSLLTMKRIAFTFLLTSPLLSAGFQLPNFSPLVATPSRGQATELLSDLRSKIRQAPKNGIGTSPALEKEIILLCERLEKCNPTPRPIRNTKKMNGFWKMLWTNFSPVAPSSGKLGPFLGDVYQDVDFSGKARNILRINLPPIIGELVASPSVVNDSTMAITFESVGNKLAGVLPLGPKIQFEPNKEVRLWEHVYVDDDIRILYARRKEDTESRGFVYVMQRADEERFETGV